MIGSSTVSDGLQENIDGTYVSVGSHRLIVGSSTYAKPTTTDSAVWSFSSYRNVVIAGKTVNLPVLPSSILRDLAALEQSPSGIVTAGFETAISSTALSVGSSFVVIGSSTYALPFPTNPAISIAPDGAIIMNGRTLTQGEATTIAGSEVSVGSSIVVVGDKTYSLPLPTDSAVSLAGNGALIFDGVTLTQGMQTTISGTVVSAGSDFIVVAGTTYALPQVTKAPGAATSALGAIIASMHGYVSPTAGSANPTSGPFASNDSSTSGLASFTGAAPKMDVNLIILRMIMPVVVIALIS